MSGPRVLYQLVRADFLERTRRYTTLIVIGLTVYLTYLYLPPADAGYLALNMIGYRGVYNSAWVGATVTVLTVIFMPLPGFYLVKNAIVGDRRTGVGQIIATTRLTKAQYTLGKMLSNWVYLAAMAGVALLAAVGTQLIRGEIMRIAVADYLAPYVFITLPMMGLVAAVAVLFESIGWLRGGFGNVAFFFCYLVGYWMMAAMFMMLLHSNWDAGGSTAVSHPTGALAIFGSMMAAGREHIPGFQGALEFFSATGASSPSTFVWGGMSWTTSLLVGRLLWAGAAIGLAWLASLFFHRFDPARWRPESLRREVPIEPAEVFQREAVPIRRRAPARLGRLTGAREASPLAILGRTLVAELRLLLIGRAWWWYVGCAVLLLGGLLRPIGEVRRVWLPLAWLWPLFVWSQLGNREACHRTGQMVFSAAYPLRRQLPAAWLAGCVVALATGSGAAVRMALAGQWSALYPWAVGAAFIPALALVLGVWSGGSKLFEVVYLVLWSLGPLNQMLESLGLGQMFGELGALDFVGAREDAIARGIPLLYLALTVALLALAFVGRKRRLQV